ncbi:MAG: hypothetical protein ACI9IT_001031 [Glaciecola sp.]|jgi:hypothetical protein
MPEQAIKIDISDAWKLTNNNVNNEDLVVPGKAVTIPNAIDIDKYFIHIPSIS